jgi:hypothetical protein
MAKSAAGEGRHLYVHSSTHQSLSTRPARVEKKFAWPFAFELVDLHKCSGAFPSAVWFMHDICAPEALVCRLG